MYHKWHTYDEWFLRSWAQQTFGHFGPFFYLFTPIITQKIKILKTWKNHLEIWSFYTCPINDNHMMYGSWDMKCDRQIFLSFWMGFDPPNTLKNQNFEKLKKMPGYIIILHMCSINQHFKKMRRTSEYTFILHKCTKNHDHMPYILFLRYGAWQV